MEKKHKRLITMNPFEREDLSIQAKGVLIYLFSKPKGWKAQLYDIIKHNTNGRDANRAAIRELVDAGYMKLIKVKAENGKYHGSYYEYYDTPWYTEEKYIKPTIQKVSDPSKLSKIKSQLCPEPWMDGINKLDHRATAFQGVGFSGGVIQEE